MSELQKIADWQVYKPSGIYRNQKLDPERCVASVHDVGRSVSFHQCCRKGTIEECGYKWCKTHAPSNVLKRRQEQDEKIKKEINDMYKRSNIHNAKNNVVIKACEYFKQKATHDDLEKAVIEYERLLNDQN